MLKAGLPSSEYAKSTLFLFTPAYSTNNPAKNFSISFTVPDSFTVNPFRFLAYQKVYFDHYRNPLYELNDPSAYNVDSYFGAPFDLDEVSSTLRYRNWNKDYFTSLSPSFQGGRYRDWETDRKSTRLNSSHSAKTRMPSSA